MSYWVARKQYLAVLLYFHLCLILHFHSCVRSAFLVHLTFPSLIYDHFYIYNN